MEKPTYGELAFALELVAGDAMGTYKALGNGSTPVVSIGQWGRVKTGLDMVNRARAFLPYSISATEPPNAALVQALKEAKNELDCLNRTRGIVTPAQNMITDILNQLKGA